MPHPSPALCWVGKQQPSKVVFVEGIKKGIHWIASNGSRKLPLCSSALSSRRLHAGIPLRKPKDDAALHSVDITWRGGQADETSSTDFSHLQLLLEWKAMQGQLRNELSEVGLAQKSWDYTAVPSSSLVLPPSPSLPSPPPLPPTFFDSNSVTRTMPVEQMRKSNAMQEEKQEVLKAKMYIPIWIEKVDEKILEAATKDLMLNLREGTRDVKKLADGFLTFFKLNSMTPLERESRLEQAQLFVLGLWIAKAHDTLYYQRLKKSSVSLCLEITADLYRSFSEINSQTSSVSYPMVSQYRATLHRLFSLLYPYSASYEREARMHIVASTIMARLLRDPVLKPSQARYLFSRHVARLAQETATQQSSSNHDLSWAESVTTILTLIQRGIITPYDSTPNPKSTNIVDTFLRLLCLATRGKQVDSSWSQSAILDIARTAQIANFQKMSSTKSEPNGDSCKLKEQGRLFEVKPFVSQDTLEQMVYLLIQVGNFNLARELAFMAPREQRSLRILIPLMRKWANFTPGMTVKARKQPLQSRTTRSKVNYECTFSQVLWEEATSLKNVMDTANSSTAIDIFNARFRSHARSGATHLVARDLRILQSILGGDGFSLSKVLSLLHDKAQIDIVRTFARAGRLVQARRWANKILIALQERSKIGNQMSIGKELKVRVLNVILLAFLRLKHQGKRIMARRAHIELLRQGGMIKEGRYHLRRAINRYIRQRKVETLKSSSLADKKKLTRLRHAINFLVNFATRHDIEPDNQTSSILLHYILRLNVRIISDQVLYCFKEQADFDWKAKGLTGVRADIFALLAGKHVQDFVDISNTVKGRWRAALIDDAIQTRNRGQISFRRLNKYSLRKMGL